VHGEQDHLDLWVAGTKAFEGLEPAQARHGNVEHHHLWLVLRYLLENLAAVACLATDLQVVLGFEQTTKPFSNDSVVVGYQYGDHPSRITPMWR